MALAYDHMLLPLPASWERQCSTCDAPAVAFLHAKWVTGRAGRVSARTRALCRAHADKAEAKYGITMASGHGEQWVWQHGQTSFESLLNYDTLYVRYQAGGHVISDRTEASS